MCVCLKVKKVIKIIFPKKTHIKIKKDRHTSLWQSFSCPFPHSPASSLAWWETFPHAGHLEAGSEGCAGTYVGLCAAAGKPCLLPDSEHWASPSKRPYAPHLAWVEKLEKQLIILFFFFLNEQQDFRIIKNVFECIREHILVGMNGHCFFHF